MDVLAVPLALLTDLKIKPMLIRAFYSANSNIYRIASEHTELSGMGTTVVLAFLLRQKAYCATVGDSRIYLYYGAPYGIHVESEENVGTIMRITIPYNTV